jgi:hypothetical protein
MTEDATDPRPVVLRGGFESRFTLAVVALVFLVIALAMVSDTSGLGLVGTLVVAVPVAAFAAGLLWLILVSSVVVTADQVVIRHFADPRTTRVRRADVMGVKLVNADSDAMPAVVPALTLRTAADRPGEEREAQLGPLVVWTWWRPVTPRRAQRMVQRLEAALELSV